MWALQSYAPVDAVMGHTIPFTKRTSPVIRTLWAHFMGYADGLEANAKAALNVSLDHHVTKKNTLDINLT